MPAPSRFNNCFEIIELRVPVQSFPRFSGTSDQDGWVTSTAICFDTGDGATCYFFSCPDDLAHGKTVSNAKVKRIALGALTQVIQCKDVSIGQIGDVDIITDAGPVSCFIVCTLNFHVVFPADGNIQDERNQMCFGFVMLTNIGIKICTGGVKISQIDMFNPIGSIIVAENLLYH